MYYSMIKKCDIADGPGVRVSLFVSGCRNHCKGCFQPETWAFDYGQKFTNETMTEVLRALEPPYIKGLTILGGDPMEPENQPSVLALCRTVKDAFPDKSIWLYTGYTFEQYMEPKQIFVENRPTEYIVQHSPILDHIDVMVDGQFVEDLKDVSLLFRGSSNQRLIDVKQSLAHQTAVLWHDPHEAENLHHAK